MNKVKNLKKKMDLNLQQFSTPSIFDFVNAPEIAAFWTVRPIEQGPWLGEELFPNNSQLGMELSWFKGQRGAPIALKPSALDAPAIPREREAFDKVVMTLAFFKESKYIDENLRQKLLMVLQTGNQMYIDAVMTQIFDDIARLVDGAALRREITRMELLTTGSVTISGNGQEYTLDYGFPEEHIGYADIPWSNYEQSDPIGDIRKGIEIIELETGVRPTRAILNSSTLNKIMANKRLNRTIQVFGGGDIIINQNHVTSYLMQELQLEVAIYNNIYMDDDGNRQRFIPDDKFILLPPTQLGFTWFGTTPEEADLQFSNIANVSVVDTGVAITTSQKVDPVNVDTKVSMMSLPSFENIHQVFILNTIAQSSGASVDLETLTVPKLREKAKELGIEFNSRTTKSKLINLIQDVELEDGELLNE